MSELERMQRDVDELVSALCRQQNDGLLHSELDGYRTAAENLVSQGWTRLGPGERVVRPMSADDATRIVAKALLRWEELTAAGRKEDPERAKNAAEKYAAIAEVSADASELTSGVKPGSDEARILAVFAGADHPLEFDDAITAASGEAPDAFGGRLRSDVERWSTAFRSLYLRGHISSLPAAEGEIRRFHITAAGRSLHELDGVDR